MLLACGAAGLLVITGCSAGGSPSSAGTSGASATASAPAAVTPSSTTPSSTTPSSTALSWAAALGPAVTVLPPGAAAPGHGSPGAVLAGLFQAVKDKNAAEYCGYAEPAAQAQCTSQAAQLPASQFPSAKNGMPGYAVTDGGRAVAGFTGTLCATGQTSCVSNSDPAAVFTALHTFSALWKNAMIQSDTTYSLTPLTKVNGNWYIAASS